MPEYVSILPQLMELIFGLDSVIMQTTPREFLFDGVHFCKGDDVLSELMCGMISEQGLKTIKVNEDGSLRFSLYGHVSNSVSWLLD